MVVNMCDSVLNPQISFRIGIISISVEIISQICVSFKLEHDKIADGLPQFNQTYEDSSTRICCREIKFQGIP